MHARMWWHAVRVYLPLLVERGHAVVAFDNKVRCIFRFLRTPDYGRNDERHMHKTCEPSNRQIRKLLFLVVWCLGGACELVWWFGTYERGLACI